MAGTALTKSEQSTFEELEAIVEAHKDSWFKAGVALAQIRDGRLYRASHKTFAQYLHERWDMGRSQAYRLIDASETVTLSPIGDKLKSANEAVVRELVDVEPSAHRAVLDAAAENGKPVTAGGVRSLLDRVLPPRIGKFMEKKSKEGGRPKKPKITKEQVIAATRARRSGKEVVTPAMRKDTMKLYGKLVNAMDRMGIPAEKSNPHLNAIAKLIKDAK